MCLTFCHQRGIIYNNHTCDVCEDCPERLGGAGRCEDCRHYAGNDVCDLTKAKVPRWRRCCHWNVERDERFERNGAVIPLDAVDPVLLAREYRDDIAVFAEEWGLDAEGVPVIEIAVPLVYGIPCGEWGEALGNSAACGASCGVGK